MSNLWSSSVFQLSTQCTFLTLLLLILLTQSIRIHYMNKANKLNGNSYYKILRIIDLRVASFLVIIPAIFIMLQNVIIYTSNVLSDEPLITDTICTYKHRASSVLTVCAKLGIHLFVILRSKVSSPQVSVCWYRIGFGMVCSDMLLILYASSPFFTMIGANVGKTCTVIYADRFFFVWLGLNDFIIGIYCLLIFVLPLRRIIQFEQDTDTNVGGSQLSLYLVVKKILVYSSCALLSTFTFTILAVTYPAVATTVFSLDHVINSFCVVMQFANVDDKMVPPRLIWICHLVQMDCCWSKAIRQEMSKSITKRVRSLSGDEVERESKNQSQRQSKESTTATTTTPEHTAKSVECTITVNDNVDGSVIVHVEDNTEVNV